MKLKVLVVSLLAFFAISATATAAVFTAEPPAQTTDGTGPFVWQFQSDAPGTMWGNVTWKVSTEPEWHMCGGFFKTVTLSNLPIGTYTVEIADEVSLVGAGQSGDEYPYTRCGEPHVPAEGPAHPRTISTLSVVAPPIIPPTAPVAATPAAPITVLPEPAPVKASECSTWQSIDAIRLASAREAAKKFNHAKTHGERNYWHAQLKRRAAALRLAYRKVQQFCP